MEASRTDASPRDVRAFALLQCALTGTFVVVLFLMLGGTDGDLPPWWATGGLAAVLVATTVLAERVWLGTEPLDPAEPAVDNAATALSVYAAQTARRLVLCEIPLLSAVIATFALDAAAWPLLLIGVPALAVLVWEVWPSLRNVSMTASMLERHGAPSGLIRAFV